MPYIEPRGEKFKVRIYVRGEGKRWLPGSWETEDEAFAAGVLAEQEAPLPRGMTVREFALNWTATYPRQSRSTMQTYEAAAKRIANDRERIAGKVLADTRMSDVTRQQARAYAMLRGANNRNVLSAMFNDAASDGLVNVNPFQKLNLPQSRGRKDILPLTRAEVDLLADTALEVWPGEIGLTMRGLIMFQAYVGTRGGEALALRRSWLDYAEQEVHIRKRLYDGIEDNPKNNSVGTVVFPAPCHAAVRAVPVYPGSERVFNTPMGKAFSKSQFYRYWHPVRCAFEAKLDPHRQAELAEARGKAHLDFHELRHFCATYLLDRGLEPKDVAKQLRHKDGGKLVVDRYGHPDEQIIRDRIKAAFV